LCVSLWWCASSPFADSLFFLNRRPKPDVKLITPTTVKQIQSAEPSLQDTPTHTYKQGSRPKCKLCWREHIDESPRHLQRAIRRGLQGGVFKKRTTPERRHRPIKRSWVFTRSTQEDQEKPKRRLQEGNDVKDVAAASRKDPGKGFPSARTLILTHRGTEHRLNGNQAAATERSLASCHAALTAVATSQHLDHRLARQPIRSPPSRAATPASGLLKPLT
jgi:hypothetical protein